MSRTQSSARDSDPRLTESVDGAEGTKVEPVSRSVPRDLLRQFLIEGERVIIEGHGAVLANNGKAGTLFVTNFRHLFLSEGSRDIIPLGTKPLATIEKFNKAVSVPGGDGNEANSSNSIISDSVDHSSASYKVKGPVDKGHIPRLHRRVDEARVQDQGLNGPLDKVDDCHNNVSGDAQKQAKEKVGYFLFVINIIKELWRRFIRLVTKEKEPEPEMLREPELFEELSPHPPRIFWANMTLPKDFISSYVPPPEELSRPTLIKTVTPSGKVIWEFNHHPVVARLIEEQRELREQQLREEQQQLREEQLREEQLREEQLREQQLREQQLREELQKLREEQLREELQKLSEEQLREELQKLREQQLLHQREGAGGFDRNRQDMISHVIGFVTTVAVVGYFTFVCASRGSRGSRVRVRSRSWF